MLRSNLLVSIMQLDVIELLKNKTLRLQLFCRAHHFNLDSDRVFRKTRRFHFQFAISAYIFFSYLFRGIKENFYDLIIKLENFCSERFIQHF